MAEVTDGLKNLIRGIYEKENPEKAKRLNDDVLNNIVTTYNGDHRQITKAIYEKENPEKAKRINDDVYSNIEKTYGLGSPQPITQPQTQELVQAPGKGEDLTYIEKRLRDNGLLEGQPNGERETSYIPEVTGQGNQLIESVKATKPDLSVNHPEYFAPKVSDSYKSEEPVVLPQGKGDRFEAIDQTQFENEIGGAKISSEEPTKKLTAQNIEEAKQMLPAISEKLKELEDKTKLNTTYDPSGIYGTTIPSDVSQEDYSSLNAQKKVYSKIKDYVEAISKGDQGAASKFVGGLTTIDLADLLSVGFKGMGTSVNVLESAKRYSNGTANENDKQLLLSKALLDQVQETAQKDRSISVGTGLADMAPWLAQFAITGGVGSTVSKAALGSLESMMAKNIIGKITGRLLAGTVSAAVQTPMQIPSMVQGTAERMTGRYENQNGNLTQTEQAQPLGEALGRTYANNFLETFSERVVGDGFDGAFKALGSGIVDSKVLGKTFIGDIINFGRNNRVFKMTNKTLGLNSPITENIEEAFTGLTQPLVTERSLSDAEKQIQQYFTAENLFRTFLTTAAMGTGSGLLQLPNGIISERKYKNGKNIVDNLSPEDKATWDVITTAQTIDERKDAFMNLWQKEVQKGTKASDLKSLLYYYQEYTDKIKLPEQQQAEQPQENITQQPVSPDTQQQFTVSPRQTKEAEIRQMADQIKTKDTGTIKIVEIANPEGTDNSNAYVVATHIGLDGKAVYRTIDYNGVQGWATEKSISGEPQEIDVESFVAQNLVVYDQQEQANALSQQNQMMYKGQLIERIGENIWQDENYNRIQLPEEEYQAWVQAKEFDPNSNPDIVTQQYGKSKIIGTKNEDGSILISQPATAQQAEALKTEVEESTGGNSTVKAQLVENQDATAPQQFQLSIVPVQAQNNESAQIQPENLQSDTSAPSQDNGLKVEPTERKIKPQTFGKTQIDIIEGEEFDEVVPNEKVTLEKALPILEKEFKDNEDYQVVSERVQVEIPAENKYKKPTYETVIKSIKIVPKEVIARQKQADTNALLDIVDEFNSTPQNREDKQKASEIQAIAKQLGYQTERNASNQIRLFDNSGTISRPQVEQTVNNSEQQPEKVAEVQAQNTDDLVNSLFSNENSLQNNQQNEKPVENITEDAGQINQLPGENTPQAQQGQGNEEGLEENVNDPDLANISPTILAARSGDIVAQNKLKDYGIEWEQTTTYRFIGQSEVDVLFSNKKVESKRFTDAGIDVTTSPNVTSAANSEYRVTFKESFDINNGLNKVRVKSREEGDHNLEKGRGYDINDVQKIERLDEDGNVIETLYDAKINKTSDLPSVGTVTKPEVPVSANSAVSPVATISQTEGNTTKLTEEELKKQEQANAKKNKQQAQQGQGNKEGLEENVVGTAEDFKQLNEIHKDLANQWLEIHWNLVKQGLRGDELNNHPALVDIKSQMDKIENFFANNNSKIPDQSLIETARNAEEISGSSNVSTGQPATVSKTADPVAEQIPDVSNESVQVRDVTGRDSGQRPAVKKPNSITGKAKEVEVSESDIQGLALQYFINGGMVKSDEILRMFKDSSSERGFRISYTSNENGQTVNQIAHDIWQALPENIQNGLAEMDVYNAVEKVIMEHISPISMAKEQLKRYSLDPNQGFTEEWLNEQIRIEEEERRSELELWYNDFTQLEINGQLPTENELIELFLPENTDNGNQENDQRGNVSEDRPIDSNRNDQIGQNVQGSEPGVQGEVESQEGIEYAKNLDGSLKVKSEYTPEEWQKYTKSVIDKKVAEFPEQEKESQTERFGLKPTETLQDLKENINSILEQYSGRDMASIQVETYMTEHRELGQQYLAENGIKTREELKAHLAKLQSKAREGKGKERQENKKQFDDLKAQQNVDAIIDMANKAEAEMQKQIEKSDKVIPEAPKPLTQLFEEGVKAREKKKQGEINFYKPIKEGGQYGDWTITRYAKIKIGDNGENLGGGIKLTNQKNFDVIQIWNDQALRASQWYTNDFEGIGIRNQDPKKVIERSVNAYAERNGFEKQSTPLPEEKHSKVNNTESAYSEGDNVSFTFADGSDHTGIIQSIEGGKIKIKADGKNYTVRESQIIGKENEVSFRIDQNQTNTPEFKNWFGKSVFTENGKVGGTPMVLYHGTDRNFDSFRNDRMIYLTPSAEYANMYTAGQSAKGAHYVGKSEQELAAKTYSGESVMPVFAMAEKPFDTRNPKHKAIFQKEYFGKYGNGAPLDPERGLPDWTDAEDLQEFFDEKGYDFDGLVLAESHGNITYAVFSPNQVKSATGNSGEFGKETNDVRFRISTDTEENNLVAVHNIKPEGLLNADRLGGLPMPSIAIIDVNNGFNSYGEITLIADKDFIDPKKNKSAKVFASDVYSARYPSISHELPKQGNNKLIKKVNDVVPEEMVGAVLNGIKNAIDDGGLSKLNYSDSAKVLFLSDTQKPLEIKYSESKIPESIQKIFIDNGWKNLEYFEVVDNNDIKKQLTDLYFEKDGADKEVRRFLSEDGFLNGNLMRNFINDVKESIRSKGKVDTYATRRAADNYVRENNLQDEFESYIRKLYNELGVEEKIYRGYSNSGNRLYSPHTLSNVLKEMKKSGIRGGENFGYGAGNIRAKVTPEFKNISQIKENRDRITQFDDDIKDSANQELIDVMDAIKPFYKFDSGSFGYYDDNSDELVPLARSGRSESFKQLDEESRKMVADFLNKLANMPTEYFEAKINRGVSLAEFKNALIPEDTSQDIRDILKFNGINAVEYKDNADRTEKLKQVTEEQNVRFRILGETGAANLDKAEEATTRLDNLKVAKEMEGGKSIDNARVKFFNDIPDELKNDARIINRGEDTDGEAMKRIQANPQAKAAWANYIRAQEHLKEWNQLSPKEQALRIKLATGWERGADGKWRYEVPDGKVNIDVLRELQKNNELSNQIITFDLVTYRVNDKGLFNIILKKKGATSTKEFAEYKNLSKNELISIIDNKQVTDKILAGEGNESIMGENLDEAKEIKIEFTTFITGGEALSNVVNDPELYKAYPSLKDVIVTINKSMGNDASFSIKEDGTKVISIGNVWKQTESSIAHEIQHAIQEIEGFAKGGTPETYKKDVNDLNNQIDELHQFIKDEENDTKDWLEVNNKLQALTGDESNFDELFDKYDTELRRIEEETGLKWHRKRLQELYDKLKDSDGQVTYKRLAGEVESRNVQTRMNMTPEERLSTLLSETEDVSREDQIVLMDGLGVSNLESENFVRSTVDKLQSIAPNSAPIVIIKSDNDIPEKVKTDPEYISNPKGIEAFWFDGKIYIFPEMVKSRDHLISIWIHENGLHNGIRNIIPSGEMKQFLGKVYDSFYQVAENNPEFENIINMVEANYPNSSKEAKAEEFLAYLSEKVVSEKDLTPMEQSLWSKYLDLFRDFMRRLFKFDSNLLTEQQIIDITRFAVQSNFQTNEYANSKPGGNSGLRQKTSGINSKSEGNTGTSANNKNQEGSQSGKEIDRSVPLLDRLAKAKEQVKAKKAGVTSGEKPNDMDPNSENYKIDLLNSIEFIETGETRIDEDYEPDDAEYNQRKVFIPVYLNNWNYADNTDPNQEQFDTVNEALSDLMEAGDMSETDRYFTPTKETQLAIKEAWIGSDGEIIEESKIQSYDDWAYRNESNEFVKKFGNEGLIDSKTFSGREDSARELEQEVYWNISKDLVKSYDGLKLSIQERGKYRTISAEDKNGNDVGLIQIRIADHSYNPRNNDDSARSGNFISIEIANKNETKGKFHGSYGLQFDGDNTYDEVIETVNDRIKEIIDGWNIKKELSNANESNESSIQFESKSQIANAEIKYKQNSELPNTIIINGVSRPTLNSNGKPIAQTEEGIRNFWKWFRDSKVVDNEGRPLVVYHGTNTDFNIFKESTKISADPGIYFSDKESVASRYGEKVGQYYLSINDIVEYDADGKSYNRAMSDSKFSSEIRHVGKWSDGLVLKNIYDHPEGKRIGEKSNVFVVTEPNFIKSATGNNGSFDPDNNNINYKKTVPLNEFLANASTNNKKKFVKDGAKMPDSVNSDVDKNMKSAHGLRGESILDKLKRWGGKVREQARHFEHIREADYPAVYNKLRILESIPDIVKKEAYDKISTIIRPIVKTKNYYEAFERFVVLNDLMSDINKGLYDGKDLPWGYNTQEEVRQDAINMKKYVNENPDVKKVIEERNAMMRSIRDQLIKAKLLDPKAKDSEAYFHHQVLMFMESKPKNFPGLSISDARVKNIGAQKGRVGSAKAYNTNYIEAEFEVIAQTLEQLETRKILDRISNDVNIFPDIFEQAQNEGENWKSIVPEGYVKWYPKKGTNAYKAASFAEKALTNALESPENVETVLEMTAEANNSMWVIPADLAKQLDSMKVFEKENPISQVFKGLTTGWKQYILFNPYRAAKYMVNNLSGDIDIVLAYDPRVLKYVPDAVRELKANAQGNEMSADMQAALHNRVIGSGVTVNEIQDINKEGVLKMIQGSDYNLIRKYFSAAMGANNFRENTLRLAAYKYFKDKVDSGKNVYGASKKKSIDAIADKEEKAGRLAVDLLGDYGNISQAGVWMREHVFPFWSWVEVNSPRYYHLLRNTRFEDSKTLAAVGARKTGINVVKYGLKASILMALIVLWNRAFYPDEDDEISQTMNDGKLYLILGRTDEGDIRMLKVTGSLSDMLSYAGLDNVVNDVNNISKGKSNIGREAKEAGKAIVNKFVQGAMPLEKTAVEPLFGKTIYPDVFQPREIRDAGEHISRVVSMDKVYRLLTKKPMKSLSKEMQSLLLYNSNPGEAAYYAVREKVYDFLDEKGVERLSGAPTKKSNTLYYYKQALKYGDEELAKDWLQKYYDLGGTEEGMRRSIDKGEVLSPIPEKYQDEFMQTLDKDDLELIEISRKWYDNTYK